MAAAAAAAQQSAASKLNGPPLIHPAEMKLLEVIGRGAFGQVWKGRCRGTDVAIKVPKNQNLPKDKLDKFLAEVEIMSKLFHPNVALFMGASVTPGKIGIVSELLDCDLSKFLSKNPDLPLSKKCKMALDAAHGMAWLHGMNPAVIHHDFKLANMLVSDTGRVKIADFGLSRFFEKGQQLTDQGASQGTPIYMAPEILKGQHYNEKADVYSFGITLWEIYTQTEAFAHHSDYNVFRDAICNKKERPLVPQGCPQRLAQLMERCWADSAHDRPLFPEIVLLLEEAVLEACIRDEKAKAFWKTNFLKKEVVPWATFSRAFFHAMQLPLPHEPKQKSMYLGEEEEDDAAEGEQKQSSPAELARLLVLKALLVEWDKAKAARNEVAIERFGDVIGWFGPIEFPYAEGKNTFLDRVVAVLSAEVGGECWFHGDVSANEASQKLKTAAPGTFLVRFSTNVDFPTSFTISKVSQKKTINHVRVVHLPGEDFSISERHYPTLIELIAGERESSFLQAGLSQSPYKHIF